MNKDEIVKLCADAARKVNSDIACDIAERIPENASHSELLAFFLNESKLFTTLFVTEVLSHFDS